MPLVTAVLATELVPLNISTPATIPSSTVVFTIMPVPPPKFTATLVALALVAVPPVVNVTLLTTPPNVPVVTVRPLPPPLVLVVAPLVTAVLLPELVPLFRATPTTVSVTAMVTFNPVPAFV